jgi:2C-methyl-D-erythritol 2,4-cyclodiphosphate synthase
MKAAISEHTGVHLDQINIKSKTTDGLGFTGTGEGIAAYCVVLLARGRSRIDVTTTDDLLKQNPDPQ